MAAFGTTFTDHTVVCGWMADNGWSPARLRPYGPFRLEPASAVVQYGQEIFEGLNAYRHADGEVRLFRPDSNAARMRASARRLALPGLPEETFLAAVELLVDADRGQVPTGPGESLYLRPFMFGSEPFLGETDRGVRMRHHGRDQPDQRTALGRRPDRLGYRAARRPAGGHAVRHPVRARTRSVRLAACRPRSVRRRPASR